MSILINIASEFTGKKAFDKAGKSTSALEKGAKKLGTALAGAFAVDKVIAFGKASVKAFAEEEKSAAMLANTMKNLGVAFAAPQMETFISQLSQTAAVADDVLRPAMQKLLTQTGDYFKSQELLTQAIEISRGSGVELDTVVQDLANAYVGNTKGLKKYNLGLTQAELKTMKFTDVQKKLTNQFKGSNAAYLETYAGKMEVLKTAAGEAQETIGKGLVDALSILAGDTSIQGIADQMQELAEYTANVITGFATLTSTITNALPAGIKLDFKTFMPPQVKEALRYLDYFAKIGEKAANSKMENASVQMFMTDMANLRLQVEANVIKKKELDLTKKRLAEERKAALAKKQAALFDLEKIGLVAALQGKITEEEKLRLNLQLALLTGNDVLATKLSAQLADSIDSTGKLKDWLTKLPDANNPFKGWDEWLKNFKAELAGVATVTPINPPATNGTGLDFGGNKIGAPVGGGFTPPPSGTYGGGGSAPIVVQIDGKTIASALMDQSLSGNQAYVNRRTGGFD